MPHGAAWAGVASLGPVFLSNALSFLNEGVYWSNHHHMLHEVKQVNGRILWANMHFLFWLSLLSFTTGWMDENHFPPARMAHYAPNLLMCAVAYFTLQKQIIVLHGKDSLLANAMGGDTKGKGSLAA